ncbi:MULTISPECIES: ABC transporter substrate-binding protein [Kocuria]|uniref:ABC transporter substrate-binding protein n=1 Tax=Kocuria TaxID=57493 RepID=UPI001E644CC7|nr:ABC transporter substrate-binding protein [Kocuria sp. CCUG 69068]
MTRNPALSHRPRRTARTRARLALAASAVPLFALTGCGAGADAEATATGVVDYWMWDTNQLPAYQKCAEMFEAEHPDQDVRITQTGWGDYWTKLTAGFIADTGPDVFTNHVSKYPQFAELEVLAPLEEHPATAALDPEDYQDGLVDLWTGPDGHQYGVPKDWDTVAAFYNEELLAEAGLTPADLEGWSWNPEDGGSFEDLVAHLTVDENGVRGDEPGFDKDHVAVYGLGISEAGGSTAGQGQWSAFAASNGWRVTNEPLWGDHYNLDDPSLHETLDWYFGLSDKGYMPDYGQFNAAEGVNAQLASGSAAMVLDGAWMISTYAGIEDFPVGTARTPVGPDGTATTMLNGLADSIVKDTDNPEGAAQWAAFMGSAQCQQEVARAGVVFPSRQDATPLAAEAYRQMGIDPEPFIAPVEEGNTVYFPVTKFGADVSALMNPALEDIYANRVPASTLTEINDAVNVLFETDETNDS